LDAVTTLLPLRHNNMLLPAESYHPKKNKNANVDTTFSLFPGPNNNNSKKGKRPLLLGKWENM